MLFRSRRALPGDGVAAALVARLGAGGADGFRVTSFGARDASGERGLDVKPKADGARKQAYVDRIELQPIDPQTNGPQLLYGLRYHQHVVKPGQSKIYHDQVGYWLWEPATGTIVQTLTIPRAQIVMAVGRADANAKQFELVAKEDDRSFGKIGRAHV